jgi:hypothetical protein
MRQLWYSQGLVTAGDDAEYPSAEPGITRLVLKERRAGTMIDTMRSEYPTDMTRAADFPAMGTLEHMANDSLDRLRDYARKNPTAFGLWALGIGFVLGWKLKPW